MMKLTLFVLLILILVSPVGNSFSRAGQLQGQALAPSNLSPADIDRIIRAFTAKETDFRKALNEYTFKRDAVIQTIGIGGQISGEYRRVSHFVFDDKGARYEKVELSTMPTLRGLTMTPEDLDDLGGIEPFALEAGKMSKYNFTYAGRERIDELDLYMFDVSPKVMPNPKKSGERYFKGRVWVDDRDLQIVKARGKGVPEGEQRFPTFETYREEIDGHYWFPTYTYADESLVFPNGRVVHVRMRVRYTDFVRLRGKVRVTEENIPGSEVKPSPTPAKPQP